MLVLGVLAAMKRFLAITCFLLFIENFIVAKNRAENLLRVSAKILQALL